ncbi:TPM domain-containing protein [Niveibacterium sp.]|uniref:TPM domain-containing protein n=1 Tax=Niveibacterium sp. TaxID=2017444 RepID=UPI0035B1A256
MPGSIGHQTSRPWRFVHHGFYSRRHVRRVLDDAVMKRLQALVSESETRHSGEIRIVVEAGLPNSYLWKRLSARDRAITLFGKLRVWDTEHNNGVLIYLLLAERRIEIIADRALDRRVSIIEWHSLLGDMRAEFAAGRFEQGLTAAVAAVSGLLRQHFPLAPGESNPNELSDAPVRLG